MSITKKFFVGTLVAVFALVGASAASAAYMHTVTLKVGSSGSQVMSLQQTLNMTSCKVSVVGAGAPGYETMTFGPKTKSAVMCFQAANGLAADGVVGPMTGAKLVVVSNGSISGNFPVGCTSAAGYSSVTGFPCASTSSLPAGCTSTAGYSPQTGVKCDGSSTNNGNGNSGSLSGGAGSVDTYSLSSGLNNEEVGEDEEDVKVAGLKIENSDDSDIRLTAVKLVFNEGTAGSDFEDYADEVSVWLDDKEVARVDASDFNDDNDWTKNVSLDSDAVIDSGDTANLYVAISGVSNLDSADVGDTWTVDFTNVRFVDAQGASTTEDPATGTRTFSFETFAASADVELKITEADQDVNDTHVVQVDATSDTDDVELLSFNLEAEGDSDITIDSLPILLTTVETTGDDPDDLITDLTLYADGEEIGSESTSTSNTTEDVGQADSVETVVFDDLDYTIDAGKDVDFTVKATVVSIADTLDAGDSVYATFGETQTDLATFDAEDESGENLADADKTGGVTGEAIYFYANGFTFDLTSTSAAVTTVGDAAAGTPTSDIGTFKLTYKLTAFGGDISIDKDCLEDQVNAADQGTEFTITNSGSNTTTCSVTSTADENPNDSNAWVVRENDSETFTLTVAATATADHFAKVYLSSINWDDDITDASPDQYFTAGLGESKTSTNEIFLNDN